MRRAEQRHGDVALRRRRRRVPSYDHVAQSYHLVDRDVRVEHVTAPVRAVAPKQLGVRVLTVHEPLEHARAVREARPPGTDHRVVQPETHRTCQHI